MTRLENRQKIHDFLIQKGADRFWVGVALKHIMLNFAGNTYWIDEIRNPKAIIGGFGMVDKFSAICTINTETKTLKGQLIYTHDASHKVQVKQIL